MLHRTDTGTEISVCQTPRRLLFTQGEEAEEQIIRNMKKHMIEALTANGSHQLYFLRRKMGLLDVATVVNLAT